MGQTYIISEILLVKRNTSVHTLAESVGDPSRNAQIGHQSHPIIERESHVFFVLSVLWSCGSNHHFGDENLAILNLVEHRSLSKSIVPRFRIDATNHLPVGRIVHKKHLHSDPLSFWILFYKTFSRCQPPLRSRYTTHCRYTAWHGWQGSTRHRSTPTRRRDDRQLRPSTRCPHRSGIPRSHRECCCRSPPHCHQLRTSSFLLFPLFLYRYSTGHSLDCKRNPQIFLSRDFDKTLWFFAHHWHDTC